MATLEQLQQHFGTDSPEEAILAASKRYGISPTDIADEVGYDLGGSKTGARFDEAGDNYVASLSGLGEAVARKTGLPGPSDYLRRVRQRNEAAAQIEDQRARDLGAVQALKDVHGAGDLADYAVGQGINMTPYLAEMAVGAGEGRMLVGGAKLALGLRRAESVEEAAAAARASKIGGGVAVYPHSVADELQAQRDQNGTTNLGTAALLGVPQAALMTAAPVERLAAEPGLVRSGIDALDNLTGVPGALARTGATAARLGIEQGVIGAGSEGISQLARMSVDPNASLTSPDAVGRYEDAGVSGLVMGGALSGLGGWRRSEHYQAAPKPVDAPGGTDLLGGSAPAPAPLMLGHDPTAGQAPYYAFPDGSSALTSEAARIELQRRTRERYAPQEGDPEFQLDGSQPASVGSHDDVAQAIGGTQNPDQYELFQGDGQPTFAAEQTGERARRTGGLYDTPIIGASAPAPHAPIALPPHVQAQVAREAARKADAGQPLSPIEQHLLDTYNSQTSAPQLDLPADRGFQLDGAPTPHFDMLAGEQRPDFHLEMQDGNPAQGQLDLQAPEPDVPAQAPGTPLRANQRGFVNELPFAPPEAKIKTPLGQQLFGLAQSLAHEGIMDQPTLDQVTTLLTQGKIGLAGKIVDKGMSERQSVKSAFDKAAKQHQDAADAVRDQQQKLIDAHQEQLQQAADAQPDAKEQLQQAFEAEHQRTADAVMADMEQLARERAALLAADGRRPPMGSPKRDKWNALTQQIKALQDEHKEATKSSVAGKSPAALPPPDAGAAPSAAKAEPTTPPQDTATKIDKYTRLLECLRG